MKKFYLLLAVGMIASAASAKVDYTEQYSKMKKSHASKIEMPAEKPMETVETEAVNYTPYMQLKEEPVEGETFYYRPYGTFYVGYNAMTANAYYSPYLYMPNYRDVTFRGTTVGTWLYQQWNREVSGRPWLTLENEQYLTMRLITETDSVPFFSNGGPDYYLFGHNSDLTEEVPMTMYAHNDLATRLATNTNGKEGWFATSAYWAYRDRNNQYSSRLFTGALDVDGGNTAYWFGKNYTGYNACAIFCEKPQNPYVLRGACMRYANLVSSDVTELKMSVYKAGTHEARAMSFGELIAEGTGILPASASESSGYVYFTFTEEDEEFGLVTEVTPEINDSIYVVLSGYDSENIAKMGIPLSGDVWDEGIGETGYNIQLDENGNVGVARGLTAMFNGFKGYTAPAIWVDVIFPFLINNYVNDGGVRKYDVDGTLIYDGSEGLVYGSNFSAYSTSSSEEWTITLADGSDIPEWLTLTPEDEYNSETGMFSGEVNVGIDVEALPDGLAGRKAVVRLSIPGCYYDLTIIEGEEPADVVPGDVDGDGVCTAGDITALYNWLLNNDDSALVNGDQDGDGSVTAGDVTYTYNVLLGN